MPKGINGMPKGSNGMPKGIKALPKGRWLLGLRQMVVQAAADERTVAKAKGEGKGQRQRQMQGCAQKPNPSKLHGSPPARSNPPYARAENTR